MLVFVAEFNNTATVGPSQELTFALLLLLRFCAGLRTTNGWPSIIFQCMEIMKQHRNFATLTRVAGLAVLSAGLMLGTTALAQVTPATPNPTTNPATNPATGTPSDGQTGTPVVLVDPGMIYNAKTPTDWVGKSVVLQNVMVQDTNDDGNFWIGSDDDHRLLIVKAEQPNLTALKFNKGDVVTVSGVVHPASRYMSEQTTASKGSMEDATDTSGVILLASEITNVSSTRR